jgi:hypothetical protein
MTIRDGFPIAAWVELEFIEPFTVINPFVQRYNPGEPITLGTLATHHIITVIFKFCLRKSKLSKVEIPSVFTKDAWKVMNLN